MSGSGDTERSNYTVEVRTGSRLHFGLLTHGPGPGRLGGIGLMIDTPGVMLRVSHAVRDSISGPPDVVARAAAVLRRVRAQVLMPVYRGGFELLFAELIPPHRGLGSGTQFDLAVYIAIVSASYGCSILRQDWWSFGGGRGTRTRVGRMGFHFGGFHADSGPFPIDVFGVPNKIIHDGIDLGTTDAFDHRLVPEEWRFVLVDPTGSAGVSGEREMAAFAALPPMPAATTERLCGLVREAIRPGLEEAAFEKFAAGIGAFNHAVGEYFAPVQGGVYAHPLIRRLETILASTDWPYLAQSSWGPAAAVLCNTAESATDCVAFLRTQLGPQEATITVAAPRNVGASVEVISDGGRGA